MISAFVTSKSLFVFKSRVTSSIEILSFNDFEPHHIDFIETVYDNIKNPLGYFIHKLSYFKGNEESRN
jgi:hypothetical protein